MPVATAEPAAALPALLIKDLRLLSLRGTAPEPPIRSIRFDERNSSSTADGWRRCTRSCRATMAPASVRRLQENAAVLRAARALLARQRADGTALDLGAVQLLEDAPRVELQLETTRSELSRRMLGGLPRLRDQPLAGLPRVYAIAWAWVAHADSRFEPTLLRAVLAAYQSQRELKLVEYRALPAHAAVVLLENLRRLEPACRLVQVARDAAHRGSIRIRPDRRSHRSTMSTRRSTPMAWRSRSG